MADRIGANLKKTRLARKSRGPGRIFIALLVVAVASAAGFFAAQKEVLRRAVSSVSLPQFQGRTMVEAMKVQGSLHVLPAQIVRQCGMEFPLTRTEFNRKFSGFDKGAWVEKATVRYKDTLAVIKITERKPVALYAAGRAGETALVDKTGFCMPLDSGVVYDLPLVSGLTDSIDEDDRRRLVAGDAVRMNRFLELVGASDTLLYQALSQVHFGTRVRVMLRGAQTVVVIDEKETASCLARLVRLWETVQSDSVAPVRIDLAYRNLAFVQRESERPSF